MKTPHFGCKGQPHFHFVQPIGNSDRSIVCEMGNNPELTVDLAEDEENCFIKSPPLSLDRLSEMQIVDVVACLGQPHGFFILGDLAQCRLNSLEQSTPPFATKLPE